MTPYESRQYRAQLDDSLMAEYVPMHLIFAGIPQPMRLDDEMIPGRDDLESE